MAQINLLKQNSTGGDIGKNVPKYLIWFFLVILALLLTYYGWLFFQSKNIDNKTETAQTQINNDSKAALALKGRDELLTRQQQLESLSGLVNSHIYWSQLFKPLSEATLKNASYSSLTVGTDNDLTLSVAVPALEDADKYIQIFNLPEFYRNFSDVRTSGFSKIQDKNSTSIRFDVRMLYNPKIIQYQTPSNNAS
jgi:hypothetical protein